MEGDRDGPAQHKQLTEEKKGRKKERKKKKARKSLDMQRHSHGRSGVV